MNPAYDISKITAIILAGGPSTRVAALYPDMPKPMIPVAGEPFLHWPVNWLMEQGVDNFIFSTGYGGEQIETWLRRSPVMRLINWKAAREAMPLGTGGAVRACLHHCNDDIMIANGDSLTLMDLNAAANRLQDPAMGGVIVGKHVVDTSRYGCMTVSEENLLTEFNEKQGGSGLINTGLYFFRKKILEAFPLHHKLSMEYDIIPTLIARGTRIHIHSVNANTPFLDIGTPETLVQAEDFVSRHFAVMPEEERVAV